MQRNLVVRAVTPESDDAARLRVATSPDEGETLRVLLVFAEAPGLAASGGRVGDDFAVGWIDRGRVEDLLDRGGGRSGPGGRGSLEPADLPGRRIREGRAAGRGPRPLRTGGVGGRGGPALVGRGMDLPELGGCAPDRRPARRRQGDLPSERGGPAEGRIAEGEGRRHRARGAPHRRDAGPRRANVAGDPEPSRRDPLLVAAAPCRRARRGGSRAGPPGSGSGFGSGHCRRRQSSAGAVAGLPGASRRDRGDAADVGGRQTRAGQDPRQPVRSAAAAGPARRRPAGAPAA